MDIHNFLCLPEWTYAEVHEEPHLDVRPTPQMLPFYYTPPATADAVILATSSYVSKPTRSALAPSSGSTTRPSLFAGDDHERDDDDDAYVKIPLVTPLCSAAVIPSLGNQSGSSIAPTTEGFNTRDSRGKGIMVGDAAAPSGDDGVAGNYSRLKGYEEKVAGLTELELQVSTLKKVQGELLSLAASAGFERGLSMHRTKDKFADVLKNMVNFMPGAQERLAEASPLLEPKKLVCSANVPIPKDTRVSPPIEKESTMTPVSKSLELSANVVLASSVVALDQNEEQVTAVVDRLDLKMTDGAAHSKSGGVVMQGTSHVLDDVDEVTVVGSERVSSGLTDVVVALSGGEKGDGFAPSSIIEEVVVPPLGV
nr:hypothetical protein [Tanacetum cinerariifolium]